MLGREPIAPVFGRKRTAVVECKPKGSRVRLDQNIGNADFPLQVRTFAGVTRIFVASDIEPGPPVERTFAHPRDVVRHQIVSHPVALIGRAIQISTYGMNCEADTIADAGGKDAKTFSIRIEHQHACAVDLASPTCAERVFAGPRLQTSWRASHPFSVIAGGAN